MNKLVTLAAASLLLAAGAARAQSPNDAQIAFIVVTANQVDIDAGKLAESKGSSADVKAFGKQMVTDHSGVNKQAVALVTKLKVTPEDNATAQEPEERRRRERRQAREAERRGVRPRLRRSRGRVPRAGARGARQDADPERAERRAEGLAGGGQAGVRRPPRPCTPHPGDAEEGLTCGRIRRHAARSGRRAAIAAASSPRSVPPPASHGIGIAAGARGGEDASRRHPGAEVPAGDAASFAVATPSSGSTTTRCRTP